MSAEDAAIFFIYGSMSHDIMNGEAAPHRICRTAGFPGYLCHLFIEMAFFQAFQACAKVPAMPCLLLYFCMSRDMWGDGVIE